MDFNDRQTLPIEYIYMQKDARKRERERERERRMKGRPIDEQKKMKIPLDRIFFPIF